MSRGVPLWFLAAILVACALGGCSPARNKSASTVTIAEAERLVGLRISDKKDRHYRHEHPLLREVTPPDVRHRLRAQVFRLADSTWSLAEFDAYLVQDRKAYPMSTGFGGRGLMDMCVSDINRDSIDDLIYAYSCGSGIHRSVVEAYRFGGRYPIKMPSSFAVRDVDVSLAKRGERGIDLYGPSTPGESNGKVRIGQLVIRGPEGREFLDLRLDPGLSKEWRARIWR